MGCVCPISKTEFVCWRSGCVMQPHFQKLCRNNPEYQSVFASGECIDKSKPVREPMPLIINKPASGVKTRRIPSRVVPASVSHTREPTEKLLGDQIESALTFVGITKERVSKFLGRECGCAERREKLNKLHSWAKQVVKKLMPGEQKEEATRYLTEIIDQPQPAEQQVMPRRDWAYGVTTVPSRRFTTLQRSLESLTRAGFERPRLFVDGTLDVDSYKTLNCPLTMRDTNVKAYGNWILSLVELYIRQPQAERYAIFQDDVIYAQNLRDYLNTIEMDNKTYLNLYTAPSNNVVKPRDFQRGFYPSNQYGRGGLALVFDNDGVRLLFHHSHIINKPKAVRNPTQSLDGAVIEVMRQSGWKEMVHAPSLTQHIGNGATSILEDPERHNRIPVSSTFAGEDYDARQLIAR